MITLGPGHNLLIRCLPDGAEMGGALWSRREFWLVVECLCKEFGPYLEVLRFLLNPVARLSRRCRRTLPCTTESVRLP